MAEKQILPFPEDLPSWALTTPFTQPMSLPRSIELCIRVHGFALDADTCQALHRTLFRIQSGNFVIFHPESPVAEYSVATQMNEAMVSLLRRWLQRPVGFALDCVIKSSQPLSEAAQRRMVSDVFGKRPYACVRSFDVSEQQQLASPDFAWAITAGQGLPAMLPGTRSWVRSPWRVTTLRQRLRLRDTDRLSVCGCWSAAVCLPFLSRSRHVAVMGATGSGKSSFFTQMMAADIADPERRCGIGLIDPHGSLYQRVLAMVPPSRADDVVLVDTSDLKRYGLPESTGGNEGR